MADSRLSPLCTPPRLQGFELYLNNRPDLAPRTRREYLKAIKNFTKKDESLTMGRASAYLTKHPSYIVKAGLIHYARHLNRRDLLEEIREMRIKVPEPKPHDIPTYDEFMKVIKSLAKEERYLALFMLHIGPRCKEAMMVLGENFKDGVVDIPDIKGRKWRKIELPDEFYKDLIRYLFEEKGVLGKEYAFYTHNKTSFDSKRDKFNARLSEKSNRILGKTIGTHDFRRFMATYLYENTRDLQLVNRIMGHSDIKTTMKYTKYADMGADLARTKKILSELIERSDKTGTAPE